MQWWRIIMFFLHSSFPFLSVSHVEIQWVLTIFSSPNMLSKRWHLWGMHLPAGLKMIVVRNLDHFRSGIEMRNLDRIISIWSKISLYTVLQMSVWLCSIRCHYEYLHDANEPDIMVSLFLMEKIKMWFDDQ